MTKAQVALHRHYDNLAKRYTVSTGGDYASLVVPTGNSTEPIYRWFAFKEGYSHSLLRRVLKDHAVTPTDSLSLLDPFCGSGTTAVSAVGLVRDADAGEVNFHGIECNPFLHLLGDAKLAYSIKGGGSQFMRFAGTVAAIAKKSRLAPDGDVPTLSTFHNIDFFDRDALNELLSIRAAIRNVGARTSNPEFERLALVCLAASIEPSSGLRRDGRTLRRSSGKVRTGPLEEFLRVASIIEEDDQPPIGSVAGSVQLADSRASQCYPTPASIDAAIFSPPYPNNIDYTEVYKLENWLLGLINSQQQFSAQRRASLRSHGSLRWADEYAYRNATEAALLDELIQPLLDAIPQDRYRGARTQLVRGYVDDMRLVFEHTRRSLKAGGLMACIVGNSLHGRADMQLLIASDLLLARVAEIVGFEVINIEAARIPSRRRTDSSHLRESVIFARRAS